MALFPIRAIVRRFLGNDDVVHMAFTESRDRLADERRVLLKIGDRLAAAVAHTGLHPSDELIDDRRQWPLVRHASFNTLRNELLRSPAALTIPVAAAPFHGADRSHAPVDLVGSRLVDCLLYTSDAADERS